MTRLLKSLLSVILALTQLQCSNIFTPYSVQDSDDALLYSAKMKIDSGDYEAAIDDLDLLSATTTAQNDVKLVMASAYAGACGMEFIPLFSSISETDLSAVSLFQYFRAAAVGLTTVSSRCIEAEAIIKEVGSTAAARASAMGDNEEINMLMALLSVMKVGSILRNKSDLDGTGGLGNGTTDAAFNSCTNNAANLTDAEVLEIATGFALFMENLPSLLGGSSSAQAVLDGIVLAIGTYCGLAPTTKCVTTNSTSIALADKAEFIDTYRDLIKTSAVGVQSCVAGSTDTCCP